MERSDVKRGLVKQVSENGGLSALASEYFDQVNDNGDNSFIGSHGVMTSIEANYNEKGASLLMSPMFHQILRTLKQLRPQWKTGKDGQHF